MSGVTLSRVFICILLLEIFGVRVYRYDQPILENYVGRQIPSAMTARNLMRGSGFLMPQLDTGPFPNLFLVEPPIYAQVVVWTTQLLGLPLDVAGRLVSASATALAAWGLFGLIRNRSGFMTACFGVIAFGAFPVTIRYGRAFQPDAFAMGLIVAGLRCLDDRVVRGRSTAGRLLLSAGLAQKLNWGLVLLPLMFANKSNATARNRIASFASLFPGVAWYVYVAVRLSLGDDGSSASADNATNWLARLAPSSFLEVARYGIVIRDLILRSFTPIGFGLILIGLSSWRSSDRFWRFWTCAAGLTLLILFGKLHHDYYWMILAPVASAWCGLGLASLYSRSRFITGGVVLGLVLLGVIQSRSTWRTPEEWRYATSLAFEIRRNVPTDALVVGPEAILYLSERRGCRLEYEVGAARRAANEWRPSPAYTSSDPTDLVSFYRRYAGSQFFADLADPTDPIRCRLHESVRRDPSAQILLDEPGRYILVRFDDPRNRRQ